MMQAVLAENSFSPDDPEKVEAAYQRSIEILSATAASLHDEQKTLIARLILASHAGNRDLDARELATCAISMLLS